MSEWLDLMLGEIARKNEEEEAARKEAARREASTMGVRARSDPLSKEVS